jgi:hypothetical protein
MSASHDVESVKDEHCVSVPEQVEVPQVQPNWYPQYVEVVIEAQGAIVPVHVLVEAFQVHPVASWQYVWYEVLLNVEQVYSGVPVQVDVDVLFVQPGQ